MSRSDPSEQIRSGLHPAGSYLPWAKRPDFLFYFLPSYTEESSL